MTWRDRLQPASFRGVAFEYLADDVSGIGRRNQLHEYPKRDQGYVEDMGRSTESIDIEARLVGKDYLARLDELLKALRAEGPGELVHPFYGRLQVVANPACRVRHSMEEGGLCQISLSFTEAGENQYPSAQEVPSLRVLSLADRLQQVSTARFTDVFQVNGLPEWVSTEAITDIGRIVSSAQTIYRRVETAQWSDLLGNAGGLASALLGMFQGGTGLSGLQAARLYSTTPRPVTPSVAAGVGRQQSVANSQALLDLVTSASIAHAAQQIVAVESPVFDDLEAWRGQLTAVIDREVERPGLPQASFEALADLRSGVSRYVLAESATASRLRTYTPRATLPAAVLAYDLYGDASRSDELVARNGLRHPSFVPPDPLKVLSA